MSSNTFKAQLDSIKYEDILKLRQAKEKHPIKLEDLEISLKLGDEYVKNKVKCTKNFKALYEELSDWMYGNDYNGSLEFAFRNGFDLHAVSLWESSGASQLNKSAGISRKAELKEIEKLCALADIFICSHCNHHSFFWPGEIESDETSCESCGKTMKVDSRGKL